MKRHTWFASIVVLLLGLTAVSLAMGAVPEFVGPIYDGPELDYQPSIIRVQPGGQLMIVFERFGSAPYGDFYVAFSDDDGETWSSPQEILASPLYERHPSLLQLASDSFVLFYLVDETGSGAYRIHRATSVDGLNWTGQGRVELGWATSGEINPNVIREADGTLTMTYHRLYGPSYIAQSTDDGVTWDTLQTQVSDGSAPLPRVAKRESDGLYIVSYQVNPGGNNLDIYAKISTDPYDWSSQPITISTDFNSHDSQPIVLEDGTLLVTYAKTPVNYFDVFFRTSCDGLTWSDEVQVTHDASRYDTQPHPLLRGTLGRVILAWSHQDSVTPYQDHDVWVNNEVIVPPDLGASLKAVEPEFFEPGLGPLTFTLSLANEGWGPTMALLTDPMPAGTTFVPGSLWASSGNPSFDPMECVVNWAGTISTCAQVTVTFGVSTSASLVDGDVVTNTAWLTDGEGTGHALLATATADTQPPTSAIQDPGGGQVISATAYLVSGDASDTVSGVEGVAVSVDGGPWQAAVGQESWTFQWEGYGDGEHNLRSQATDALAHVETAGPGITVTVDATPPELLAFSPLSGAVDVPLFEPVVLTFSEQIEPSTLDWTMTPDPGYWAEVIWTADGTVAYLHHDLLEPGQVHTFTVTQARDQALNPLEPFQWSFTVEPRCRIHLPVVLRNTP